jgi:hypothetical protein
MRNSGENNSWPIWSVNAMVHKTALMIPGIITAIQRFVTSDHTAQIELGHTRARAVAPREVCRSESLNGAARATEGYRRILRLLPFPSRCAGRSVQITGKPLAVDRCQI